MSDVVWLCLSGFVLMFAAHQMEWSELLEVASTIGLAIVLVAGLAHMVGRWFDRSLSGRRRV